MLLCTDCLHTDDRKIDHCPSCAGESLARLTANGDVTTVPAEAGMPCTRCLQTERELKLRYCRRVLGLLIVDQIWATAGYFCAGCRRRQFTSNMAFTLVLGWWGVFAMAFRNPFAIVTNLWALFAAPMGADRLGAINVNEIRADAAEQNRHQRLADIYMSMPRWMESLSEDDFARILIDVDYYDVLNVDAHVSHGEIRGAWRAQVKGHHPDRAGAGTHEAMVHINDAWAVLGDERLRHAYDHRDEVIAVLSDSRDADIDLAEDAHDDREPPGEASPTSAQHWGCRFCPAQFVDYNRALEHADQAHPERTVIDPRNAVEVR